MIALAATLLLGLQGPPAWWKEEVLGPRPRDPWVFRCVLEERPRMLVLALHEDLWVAYDTSNCSLYGIWSGGIDFAGAVYDTRHGPQPQLGGPLLYEPEGPVGVFRSSDGEKIPAEPQYLGHRFVEGEYGRAEVELRFEWRLETGDTVRVRERPVAFSYPAQNLNRPPSLPAVELDRDLSVSGLPAGLELRFPGGIWVDEAGECWSSKVAWALGDAWGPGEWVWPSKPTRPGPPRLFGYWSQMLDDLRAFRDEFAEMERPGAPGKGRWKPSYIAYRSDGESGMNIHIEPFSILDELGD